MEELEILIQEFEDKLIEEDKINKSKKEKNSLLNAYYPRIRNYFIPFLNEDIRSYDTSYIGREKIYFESLFNREHIIMATIQYVLNSKTKGIEVGAKRKKISSINDFLSAFNSFFSLVLNKRYHMNLSSCIPFKEKLTEEIKERLVQMGYELQETEKFPAIRNREYKIILNYFQNDSNKITDKQLQVFIMFQLCLLFGLSNATLGSIRAGDIDMDRRTLKIISKNNTEYIILELPYKIFNAIRSHIRNNKLEENDMLFYTNTKNIKGKQITSGFFTDILDKIKNEYTIQHGSKNVELDRFTQYGMVKYAIANMLDENINVNVIEQITSRDIKFIMSCIPENKLESIDFNNYVNVKLRNTDTYKDFN